MNILWIEDFGGNLNSGEDTLNLMFGNLLSFENWDEDELSLLDSPKHLEKFTRDISHLHWICLCRNYFDYREFKSKNDIINKIDAIIIDIRLDFKIDYSLDIPSQYQDKIKFHQNAGFYIFNDLAYLGFPVEKMCFMTGETGSLQEFQTQCEKIYIPRSTAFEKKPTGYEGLKQWIDGKNSDYMILRRGIIEGCQYAKKLVDNDLYFNEYVSKREFITPNDIYSYLDVIERFLPLSEPIHKSDLYRLFIRTLSHEWESADNINPSKEKKDSVFAWVMRNTRHWITHNSNLFSDLDEKIVAYLFILNIRAMFKADDTFQRHEEILLFLFSGDALTEQEFEINYKDRLIPISKAYLDLKNLVIDEKKKRVNIQDAFYFTELANNIQLSDSSLRADKQLFKMLLYQSFWLVTSNPHVSTGNKRNLLEIKFWEFNYIEKPYIRELARHIYKSSFPEV